MKVEQGREGRTRGMDTSQPERRIQVNLKAKRELKNSDDKSRKKFSYDTI